MSEPAISLAFFDREREVHGTLRSGVAVLFAEGHARALDQPPEIDGGGDRFSARHGDDLELEFEPFTPPADLGGARARVARVRGRAGGKPIECLGTVGETVEPPAWEGLDSVRLVSALFDEEHAVLLVARRPRGAVGHGQEVVVAHVLSGEEMLAVEQARVSTVYDAEGRQRSAGLELWLPGEDFPRRASGSARAGLSLTLEGLRVDAALMAWRMEGRDGAGVYEVTLREEPAAAAA